MEADCLHELEGGDGMRIIGGSLRGRKILAPPGPVTRPTADRVREAIFNILKDVPEGIRVLDLFAGSGALGFEALSRGALNCTFVESNPAVMRILQDNARRLDVSSRCRFVQGDVKRFLTQHHRPISDVQGIQLVFLDPPYEWGVPLGVIEKLSAWSGLQSPALFVVEMSRKVGRAWQENDVLTDQICVVKKRDYGDTTVAVLRFEWSQQGGA